MKLEGWKQIAEYLRVTERTAQNWARWQNMPVYHLPGDKGRIFAVADELEPWMLIDRELEKDLAAEMDGAVSRYKPPNRLPTEMELQLQWLSLLVSAIRDNKQELAQAVMDQIASIGRRREILGR
jgi:hypothetical protein